MPSLIGESVTLVVNFSNYADTFNNVDLVTRTFTVGAGVELTNVPVSYTFTSGGYPQTLTGSISVDVTASGYTVSFSGTQQGGSLSFILSSVADESAGSVTAATETGSSGIGSFGNQTLSPSFSNANGGTVTAGFFLAGYEPGMNPSQTVAFTLADPTQPPSVTTNTGATVQEGGLLTISNTQLQTTDSDTAAASLTYRITTVATNGILFRDLDGDNVVDAGETRGLNNTFTQADIDAGRIKFLHNGGETTSASFGFSVTDGHDTVTGNTFSLTVTPVNDAPTGSGVPTDVTVTEDLAGNLDLSGVTLADVDSTTLTLTLTASAGTMTASSGGGVIASGSGSGTLTLTGSAADLQIYLGTVSNVQYTGAANASGSNAASVSVSVGDGTDTTSLGSVNVNITAVNDAPEVTAPASLGVTEDVATALTGISFSDVDAGSASVTVTLSVTSGSLSAVSGGDVTVGGTASALTLTGSIADINSFIAGSGVSFTTAANATDAVTLTASIDDGGNSGTGGALTDSTTVTLNVTAVNDAPTGSGLPSDVTVTEDLAGNLDLSGLTVADVDSAGNLTLTLTASAGTMAASDAGGVTVSGSGSGTLTLTGLAADLNAYLTDAAKIQYTGALNANGNNAASVAVSVGDGTDTTSLGNVNIDITAVNDAPTGSGLPTDVTVVEDTASNLNLSGLSVADVDSSILTLTLTASEGTMVASNGTTTTMILVPGPGYYDPVLMIWMPGPPILMPSITTTVTVSGSGTGTLTLTGTAADLNAYLADAAKIQYTGALNDSGDDAATLAVSVGDGTDTTPLGTVNIDITGVDDAAVPQADAFAITDVQVLSGDVFADNGNGADVDIDSALVVTAVNGETGDVGTQITLASGALLTVNANGTFDYDPNGKFEHLPVGASASDSFTYAVNGVETTVTLTINGIDNNDLLTGTAAADTLSGGILNDTLIGGAGGDRLDGGDGIDTASYAGSNYAVNVSLATGYTAGGHALGDTLVSIENLTGSDHSDVLNGDNGANRLEGGAGNDLLRGRDGADTLDGGDGNDTISYSDSNGAVDVSLASGSATGGHGTGDVLVSIENVEGSGHNDTLGGDNGANRLAGGRGNDLLQGLAGADTLDGGAGSDTASYADSTYAVNVSLATGYAAGGHALGDTLVSIENLVGSSHNDVLRGDNGANRLEGGFGSDQLRGDGGADVFVFGEHAGDVDTVMDFQNGIDRLELHVSSVPGAGFSDLTIGVSGADATVRLAVGTPGSEVTVIDIKVLNAAGLIDASDFIFA